MKKDLYYKGINTRSAERLNLHYHCLSTKLPCDQDYALCDIMDIRAVQFWLEKTLPRIGGGNLIQHINPFLIFEFRRYHSNIKLYIITK